MWLWIYKQTAYLMMLVAMYLENAMCEAYPKQSLVYVINTAAIATFVMAIPVSDFHVS